MLKRKLGYSDLELTTVGFGAWAVGGGNWDWGWGVQDDRESIEAIHKALDLGINWIDTAAAYGLGHSEEMVGKAIQGKRDQVIIATKCSLIWDGRTDGTVGHRLKAWSVRKEAENSLKRLGVDVIDLYQIHWPNPEEEIEEGWAEIARLVEEGKVRYGGVSNFSVEQIKKVQKIHPVASAQPQYSMLERSPEKELLEYCDQQKIGVIVYSPMASGLLTGKYNNGIPEGTRVSLSGYEWLRERFEDEETQKQIAQVRELTEVAKKLGCSTAQLAIAWCLKNPDVSTVITGASRGSQVQENMKALEVSNQLTPEVLEQIENVLNNKPAPQPNYRE